jgi:hypothetical protein
VLLQRTMGSHVEENIAYLIGSGHSPKRIYESLCTQTVDLVFTAHPTQAIRDSIRAKYDALYRSLKGHHGARMSKLDHLELNKNMYASMQAAWYVSHAHNHCQWDFCSGCFMCHKASQESIGCQGTFVHVLLIVATFWTVVVISTPRFSRFMG